MSKKLVSAIFVVVVVIAAAGFGGYKFGSAPVAGLEADLAAWREAARDERVSAALVQFELGQEAAFAAKLAETVFFWAQTKEAAFSSFSSASPGGHVEVNRPDSEVRVVDENNEIRKIYYIR